MTGLMQDSPLNDSQREWLELLEISGNTLLTLVGAHTPLHSLTARAPGWLADR
jgi:hypothetical protein